MCGIAGSWGSHDPKNFLQDALSVLTSRGYDSYGWYSPNFGVYRRLGEFKNTEERKVGPVFIAHTRWATHGAVTWENTHPVTNEVGSPYIWLVHNGCVSNVDDFLIALDDDRKVFVGQTDSEVLANLLSQYLAEGRGFAKALSDLHEHLRDFAIAVYHEGMIGLAANKAPLYYGKKHFSSDIQALSGFESVAAKLDGVLVVKCGNQPVLPTHIYQVPEKQKGQTGSIDRPGSLMLEEIYEQVPFFRDLKEISPLELDGNQRVHFAGCGSSYYAAMAAAYFLKREEAIDVTVGYATECFPQDVFAENLLMISQSGETKDVTEAALRFAGTFPYNVHCLTNSPHSYLTTLCDSVIQMGCGPEKAVAATKSWTASYVRLLQMFSPPDSVTHYFKVCWAILDGLICDGRWLDVAPIISSFEHILLLGNGVLYPVALEGALKFKEVSYIHAEGMNSSEIKHGPLALVDEKTLLIFLVSDDRTNKVLSNIRQCMARDAKFIILHDTEDDYSEFKQNDGCLGIFSIPCNNKWVRPVYFGVVLQLLSYHVSLHKGINPDRPRNLAKSVTV